uniref:Uncharacterized protein n=1 Tax=Brassica oleracea TaxID=3712 RepID=A0A3P6E8R7_BRAOL|nr:unnamed protein product [Brassica oleracea]
MIASVATIKRPSRTKAWSLRRDRALARARSLQATRALLRTWLLHA